MPLENQPASGLQNWDAVWQAVARSIEDSPEPFAPATISNVRDLLRAIPKTCSIPDGTGRGYWSTIRIWWKEIEIEVFDDRYELYRFGKSKTGIEHLSALSELKFHPISQDNSQEPSQIALERPNYRLPGQNSKVGVKSGLATIRPGRSRPPTLNLPLVQFWVDLPKNPVEMS
jgi:hypothetical protein